MEEDLRDILEKGLSVEDTISEINSLLYEGKPNRIITVVDNLRRMKVDGGWIYLFKDETLSQDNQWAFVPKIVS